MNSAIYNKKIIPFFMATSLLTSLPITKFLPTHWGEKEQGLSIAYYPLVGLLLAFIIYGLTALLPSGVTPLVSAIFIVVLSIVLTGAIHLDGLADATDAAYAAHSLDSNSHNEYKEKILSVFKDPRVGAMAVIALLLIILSKVVLLSELIEDLPLTLMAMLVLPRLMASCYIAITPYARGNGLATSLVKFIPERALSIVLLLIVLLFFAFLPFNWFFLLFLVLFLLLFLWRSFWLKRINGFVGDCVGALIEISEVLVLFLLYLMKLS